MKANELRVGNLIKRDILDKNQRKISEEVVKICSIAVPQGFIAVLEDIKGDEIMTYAVEFCEPIPLTEEWLLKFRFEKDKKDVLRIKKETAYRIAFFAGKITLYQHGNSVTIPNIKYVHQLQNLYNSLTGVELTIK